MGIWTKKSIESLKKEGSSSSLRRALTAKDLVLLGIGVTVGAGIFSVTGIAAAFHAGPAIILSFLIAAIGCLFASFCYSELASMIPVSGSAYTYSYAAFGELIAWIIGWDLILEYAIGAATVSISWSGYFVELLKDLGIFLPQAIAASPWQNGEGGLINLPALLIVCFTSVILIIGIRESSFFNMVMVVLKLLVIGVFIVAGLGAIQWENLTPFIPENEGAFGQFGISGIFRAAGIIFFAYIGFDALSTTAQEVKNPKKDMPIGIIGSLIICTAIYIAFSFVLTGVVNYKELGVTAPVALALDKIGILFLSLPLKLAIIAGLTSVILVLLLGQSRVFYAMAEDGLLPSVFKETHPRFKTPWKSNLLLMLFVGSIASQVSLSFLSNITSTGTLLAFVIVCAGVIVLRITHPEAPRPFKVPFFPLTPILGMLVCFTMISSLGRDNWLRLFIWLIVGLAIYLGRAFRK